MRILLAGGDGTVGRAVAAELGRRHEIVKVSRSSGDLRADLMDEASIRALFETAGRIDAVVACAGHVHFGPVANMTAADFRKGLDDKLMGQINLVLIGQHHVSDGGSFTLTSGILDRDPVRQGANAAAVNGAIGAFVTSEEIAQRRPLQFTDLLGGMSGVQVQYRFGAPVITMSDPVSVGRCSPEVYIDGWQLQRSDVGDIDLIARTDRIAGVEVYNSPSRTPAQFHSPTGSCGSVVIWLRRQYKPPKRPADGS